uniref:type II toxin-antitoxin system VapC family toxin n=1 Tax=uncultured Sphingomonas sp. TaxID=158754 RepID=UPI0025DE4B5C|nr:PIN domain nuclease [uncultured Sphingomonas sp.]
MLVDSSVWIDFFNTGRSEAVDCLVAAIEGGSRVLVGDVVLAEVLQGFRSDREFARVLELLAPFERIAVIDEEVAVLGATYFRQLRARGVTVRGTIDTLIATRCIVSGIPLLFGDRDFQPFVDHCGLIPALPA